MNARVIADVKKWVKPVNHNLEVQVCWGGQVMGENWGINKLWKPENTIFKSSSLKPTLGLAFSEDILLVTYEEYGQFGCSNEI